MKASDRAVRFEKDEDGVWLQFTSTREENGDVLELRCPFEIAHYFEANRDDQNKPIN